MVAKMSRPTKTAQTIDASPSDKIEVQKGGSKKGAQEKGENATATKKASEACMMGRTRKLMDAKVISLIVDSACTKSAVTNSSDLKKPARHEVGIEGASPNYPQQSSLGGYIDGCVLSESGMHIHIQFPKDLHGLHCDDSAADLLSVRRCLRNGWCKAVLDEEG